MSSPPSEQTQSPRRVWPLQVSMRGLLLAIVGCAVICALLPHCRVLALVWILKGGGKYKNWAAQILAETSPNSVRALVKALQDRNEHVRLTAAIGFTYIEPEAAKLNPELVPALVVALNDENDQVRDKVAWALGRLGKDAEQAVPALIKASKEDVDESVQERAVWALERIRTGYRPAE